MPSSTIRKARRAKQRKEANSNRGLATAVIIAVDLDGKCGVISPQQDNIVWSHDFNSACFEYIRREKQALKRQPVVESENSDPVTE